MNSNAQEYFPSVPQKQLAQLGPTLLSLLLGLLWGAACWDWGCNEGAATPRWGCICCPKTVRQWVNEWGLNVIVMHRDNSPFIQLKMWRPLSSAEGEMWGEKATAIQHTISPSLLRRACGETRRLFPPTLGRPAAALVCVSARMEACGCTKWREEM